MVCKTISGHAEYAKILFSKTLGTKEKTYWISAQLFKKANLYERVAVDGLFYKGIVLSDYKNPISIGLYREVIDLVIKGQVQYVIKRNASKLLHVHIQTKSSNL